MSIQVLGSVLKRRTLRKHRFDNVARSHYSLSTFLLKKPLSDRRLSTSIMASGRLPQSALKRLGNSFNWIMPRWNLVRPKGFCLNHRALSDLWGLILTFCYFNWLTPREKGKVTWMMGNPNYHPNICHTSLYNWRSMISIRLFITSPFSAYFSLDVDWFIRLMSFSSIWRSARKRKCVWRHRQLKPNYLPYSLLLQHTTLLSFHILILSYYLHI